MPKNYIVTESLADPITTTVATVGTIIDLANFVEVGKRNLKLTIGVVDCKSTASTTTDQTVTVTWYESAVNSTASPTALSGAALAASTASAISSFDVLVSERYIFATALAGGTSPVWGVTASAVPLRRDF